MKTLAISGSVRKDISRKNLKTLRRSGQVPCVLYGDKGNVHFSAEEKLLGKLAYTRDIYAVEIDIEGSKYRSIMQDLQFHPVTEQILHMDFVQMFDDKPITASLPVYLEGVPKGIAEGGVVRFALKSLKVKGLPAAIPESVTLDIKPLEINDSIKVRDMSIAGVEFLDREELVIVSVKHPRALEDLLAPKVVEPDLEAMTEEERAEYEKKKAEEAAAAGEGAEKAAEGEAPAAGDKAAKAKGPEKGEKKDKKAE